MYNKVTEAAGNKMSSLSKNEAGRIVLFRILIIILEAVGKGFNEGKHPRDIELPEVEYDKGYIV